MSCISSSGPPPPPPLPGTLGSVHVPTYREQKSQNQQCHPQMDPIQEQQYANLPSKLMTAMNKDKKPFSYTLGAGGDNGLLDLSQIKSPRMKKRLQANLRDADDSKCQSPSSYAVSGGSQSPDVRFLPSSSSPSPSPSNITFKVPPPPAKSIRDLEHASLGDPSSSGRYQPSQESGYGGSEARMLDEQLAGLYSTLNMNGDYNNSNNIISNNNNSLTKNYNAIPKPFSTHNSTSNIQRPIQAPQVFNRQVSSPQVSSPPIVMNGGQCTRKLFHSDTLDEMSACFPRPPPPVRSLVDPEPTLTRYVPITTETSPSVSSRDMMNGRQHSTSTQPSYGYAPMTQSTLTPAPNPYVPQSDSVARPMRSASPRPAGYIPEGVEEQERQLYEEQKRQEHQALHRTPYRSQAVVSPKPKVRHDLPTGCFLQKQNYSEAPVFTPADNYREPQRPIQNQNSYTGSGYSNPSLDRYAGPNPVWSLDSALNEFKEVVGLRQSMGNQSSQSVSSQQVRVIPIRMED